MKMQKRFNDTWVCQLGTLGGGNHFIEPCIDEAQSVWVILHSGSCGMGNVMGRYFIEAAKKDMQRLKQNLPDKLEAGRVHQGIGGTMKIVNPLVARRVTKTMQPRNSVLVALKDRRGGAGVHRKSRGALRRAEKMAVITALLEEKGDDHA